jgi:hypothetical protein
MIESVMKYCPALVMVGSVVTSWVAWSARRQFVTHGDMGVSESRTGKRIGSVENRVKVLEEDMAVLKVKLDALPTKDEIGRVELAIAKLAGEMTTATRADLGKVELAVSNVSGELKGIASSVKSLERITHLVTRAKMGVED